MKDDKLIKIAAIGFIGLVVAPFIINTAIGLIAITATGITNSVEKARFNKKIKKGLREGTIVEINGVYYEAQVDNAKEA